MQTQTTMTSAQLALLNARQHLGRANNLLLKASETNSASRAQAHIDEAQTHIRNALRELGPE